MIPIIVHEEDGYLSEYTFTDMMNGLGRLTGCISCEVTEELNGQFTASIKIPMVSLHANKIKRGGMIYIKACDELGNQLFRVNKIQKTLTDGIVEVQLNHISYDLNKLPAKPFKATGKTAVIAAFNNASINVTYNPWVGNLMMDTTNETSKIEVAVPKPWRTVMGGEQGSILDVFGGEWKWDNITAHLMTARGLDRGVIIRYGKNVLDFKQEESVANTYTGCIGYVAKSDIPAVVGHVVYDGDGVDYPMIQVVNLTDKVNDETTPTVALVDQLTEQYVNRNHPRIPNINMDLSFKSLKGSGENSQLISELEGTQLGDTVTVVIPDINVNAKAKVRAYTYDALNEEYVSLTVGNYKNKLSDRISNMNKRIGETTMYVYPIGSVYTTYSEQNPSATFGGIWELISSVDDVYTYRRTG